MLNLWSICLPVTDWTVERRGGAFLLAFEALYSIRRLTCTCDWSEERVGVGIAVSLWVELSCC